MKKTYEFWDEDFFNALCFNLNNWPRLESSHFFDKNGKFFDAKLISNIDSPCLGATKHFYQCLSSKKLASLSKNHNDNFCDWGEKVCGEDGKWICNGMDNNGDYLKPGLRWTLSLADWQANRGSRGKDKAMGIFKPQIVCTIRPQAVYEEWQDLYTNGSERLLTKEIYKLPLWKDKLAGKPNTFEIVPLLLVLLSRQINTGVVEGEAQSLIATTDSSVEKDDLLSTNKQNNDTVITDYITALRKIIKQERLI